MYFEKERGSDSFTNTGFANCLEENGLLDMGFVGGKFTWVSSMGNPTPIIIELDRGIYNSSWKYKFPESFITHLPRINSDHNPLLLSLFSNHHPVTAFKPFRF